MKRIEGEGDGGQSSQAVPFSKDHFEELKERGLTESTPSPSMRQTDYHQIHVGDQFNSKVGSLKVKRITAGVAHLASEKGEHYMFSESELKALKAKRRSVSFLMNTNHGEVFISSEDNRDQAMWTSMKEIFKRNGFSPAESNEKTWQKQDTSIEDEEPKLKADIESEGYSTLIDSAGALAKMFHVYFDSAEAAKQADVDEKHIKDDIKKFDEIIDTVQQLKEKDEKELN